MQSQMLSGVSSLLKGFDDDDDQAAHTYDSSQAAFQTPPPLPTQEIQTMNDEAIQDPFLSVYVLTIGKHWGICENRYKGQLHACH